ncbi:hypothetical protein D3C81_1911620 [compost metagenome]
MADVQLALATGMKGVTPATQAYPEQALLRISHALEIVEAAVVDIERVSTTNNSGAYTRLH